MLNVFDELFKSIYIRNIYQIFIIIFLMFKNYSKYVYKLMNGQVIVILFWFVLVGNCSLIMIL